MDAGSVTSFLREKFGSGARIALMRPGEWSTVYSVQTAEADLVVRFNVYDEDFEKDAHATRWSSAPLPIPPIIEWGPALGRFYAVSKRVGGEHIDEVDETRMRRLLPAVFAAMDAMRTVDLSQAAGFGGWRADGRTAHRSWREWLLGIATDPPTRGAPGWRELLADKPHALAAYQAGYERIRELIGHCPEDRHLIHDDLLNRNVLVVDGRISAVLDWGSSKYGDFLYELAKFSFYQPWYPAWRRIDFVAEARQHYAAIGLEVPRFDERVTCYALHEGIGGIAYSAFRGRWEQVDSNSRRVEELLRA